MEPIKTLEHKGCRIEIHPDTDAESPREWDNAGTMVCWHRRYALGDKHTFNSPADFEEWAKENKALVLPLFLYDHSGLSMRTSAYGDPWDSGQVGYIYILPAKILEEWGKGKEAEAKSIAESLAAEAIKKHVQKRKAQIKAHTPLDKREMLPIKL